MDTLVITTDVFDEWYDDLDQIDAEKVAYYIDLLEAKGVALDHPYCSSVNGTSRHGGGLRELRVQSKGRPLRVFYRFDRQRNAIVLCGADKTGSNENKFYAEAILAADKMYDHWLEYGLTKMESF